MTEMIEGFVLFFFWDYFGLKNLASIFFLGHSIKMGDFFFGIKNDLKCLCTAFGVFMV